MMNFTERHVVFAGGGTAGHLFPGLAVAEELAARDEQWRITFAGSNREFEIRHVEEARFEYLGLKCQPFPGSLKGALRFVRDNVAGYRAARKFIREQRVDLVVNLGGYASAPMARAALAEDIPVVVLEQNAYPGRVTRWLAPSAAAVCTAFAEAEQHLETNAPVYLTGNPLRRRFADLPKTRPIAPAATKFLLVMGGSSGAQALNENVPKALYKLQSQLKGWQIVHQCGARHKEFTEELYRKLGLNARVVSFLADMPRALERADLAVCRAGGMTLAELATAGVPSVLVPYPLAKDDHQRKNADVFVQQGCSRIVDQREVVGRLDDAFAKALSPLLTDAIQRSRMSAAARQLARPNAAMEIAGTIVELLHARQTLRAA